MAKRRGRNVTVEVVTITPPMAREWLEFNTGNFRILDDARVAAYASDIANGAWDLNGAAIVFGDDGELMDGQHRLFAVIKANKSIESVVARGIDSNAGAHVDRGKPRTVAQWIRRSGVKNATTVAAVSRLCVGHDLGYWSRKGWGIDVATDRETIAFADKHHEEMNASLKGGKPWLKGVPLSNVLAVIFIGCGYRDINESETARWFRDGLSSGSDLGDMDAVLHLRNRILAQTSATMIPRHTIRMLTTLAWNKTVEGAECSANGMRIRLSGPAKQKAPDKVLCVTDI
jgi:hypothetical protein